MADCPVHGVPHRFCDAVAGQVEKVVEAIEADLVDSAPASADPPVIEQATEPERGPFEPKFKGAPSA